MTDEHPSPWSNTSASVTVKVNRQRLSVRRALSCCNYKTLDILF